LRYITFRFVQPSDYQAEFLPICWDKTSFSISSTDSL
uniref:Transposase n=1 Tax=Haemonchus placei TaxID=6290 RepID=A0A0N4WDZ9_HAEPC